MEMTSRPGLRPSAEAPTLDAQNPWPGLAAFDESDRHFFRGRDREAEELHRRITRSRLTILYGTSGTGKTSLLQAGVVPRLRDVGVLPVVVRLDPSEAAPPLAIQIQGALVRAAESSGAQAPESDDIRGLWEFLHRRGAGFWSRRNRLLLPLIVLDQFEEIFTLAGHSTRRGEFLAELADLVEGRPPVTVAARLDTNPEQTNEYDFDRHHYKILLSLREDFLPDLDEAFNRLGLATNNRFRLRAMTGSAALEVVGHAASVVEPHVAEQIVRYVARGQPNQPLDQLQVEPALLSVVCRELNNRRKQRSEAKIAAELLEATPEEVLGGFYDRSAEGLPVAMRDFLEERLVTVSGFRDSVALENALDVPGITRDTIDLLVGRRLLRVDRHGNRQRIELTHDLLVGVVAGARDRRLLREREAAALREGFREGRRRSLAVVLPLVIVTFLSWQWVSNRWNSRAALEAGDRVSELTTSSGGPSTEALAAVDTLRAEIIRLEARNEAWWRINLGASALESARATYFDGFSRLFLQRALQNLSAELRSLPVTPGDEYLPVYQRLRSYLAATEQPDRLNPALARTLIPHLRYELDESAARLVQRQFDFYARESASSRLISPAADPTLVATTRSWLAGARSLDAIYGAALQATTERVGLVAAPEVSGFLLPDPVAAFTSVGREVFATSLREGESGMEPWVLGEDLSSDLRPLLARYESDYSAQWLNVLRGIRASPVSMAEVAELARDPEPLRSLLEWLASNQTPETLLASFSAVGALVSKRDVDGSEAWSLTPLGTQLAGVFAEVGLAADVVLTVQGLDERLTSVDRLLSTAQEARGAINVVVQSSSVEPQALQITRTLASLLATPLDRIPALGAAAVRGEYRALGAAFCREFDSRVGSRYPFNRTSQTSIPAADFEAVFHPETGLLSGFHDDVLAPFVQRLGTAFIPRPGAPVQVTAAFLDFYSKARRVGESFFPEPSQQPGVPFHVIWQLDPSISEVALSLEGQVTRFTRTSGGRTLVWDPRPESSVELTATLGDGRTIPIASYRGSDSLIRLMSLATWTEAAGDRWGLRWVNEEGLPVQLEAEIVIGAGIPVLDDRFLDSLNCVVLVR